MGSAAQWVVGWVGEDEECWLGWWNGEGGGGGGGDGGCDSFFACFRLLGA